MQKSDLDKFDLPDLPGVYLFRRGRKVLYVGKATSLRDRVRSYFDDDLIATRGPRLVDMVTHADRISYETTPTVLEALVREAALIKKYHPRANVEGKDDKTFLYAVITKENIPRVLAVRSKDIDFKLRKTRLNLTSESSRFDLVLRAIYGPFPSGAQLRKGLRLIQRIFPFFDTRKPVTLNEVCRAEPNKKIDAHHDARIEFNRQINHYPREFDSKEYKHTIKHVALYLSGRGKELRRRLEREMRAAAKDERFEEAAELRRELFALDHIQDVSLIKDENRIFESVSGRPKIRIRIEAYDTAHISGTNAIGVMTVVQDGRPIKNEYRTFHIRGSTNSLQAARKYDDIASLKEVLTRRLRHPEWQFPKVIVVDGGRTHKKAAEAAIAEAGLSIPVAAVVKDERHRPREVIGAQRAGISEVDAILANAEAHRFSLSRHRRARSRMLRLK